MSSSSFKRKPGKKGSIRASNAAAKRSHPKTSGRGSRGGMRT